MPKPNWGGGAVGALEGGAQGFAAGGPVGGAIGAVTGGLKGLFGGSKKKKKPKKLSRFNKRQEELDEEQYQAIEGKGKHADLYSYDPQKANAVFDQNVANPAIRQFREKFAPEITGNFRSNGLQNSSYVGDALTRLARDIQEDLNAKRSQTLYGEEKETKNAKRNAIENKLNRQTFDYETPQEGSGASSGFGGGDFISNTINSLGGQKGLEEAALKYLPGGV